MSIHRVLIHVGLSSSSYYFQATGGRKGRLQSKTTYHEKRGDIFNQQVVEQVRSILTAADLANYLC